MMLESPLPDSMAAQHQKTTSTARLGSGMAVSARKLAATLWELQEISLLSSAVPNKVTNEGPDLHPPENPAGKRNASQLPVAPPSPASSHVTMRGLRRSSVKCRFGDNSKKKQPPKACQNTASAHLQVLKLLENAKPIDGPDDEEDTHEIEVDDGKTANVPSCLNDKAVTGENGASTTSSELLKVLNQVWALEEQHNSSTSVVSTLKSDLEEARLQVKNLTIQQLSHYRDMENLNKKLTDEKTDLQEKEQERTRKALQSLKDDLEEEKKSKRKLDLAHRKVTKELIDVKKSLMKALQDLERERKARELMEDVCDELAREVGEDKARVEALKRESMKVREEVEEERKMLQVAEVWREERVQMKLAEARLEIEEKNTALDKLRMELDAFLKAKKAYASSKEGAGSTKVESVPELRKTSDFRVERKLSSTLSNLINEAYAAADAYKGPDSSTLEVEIAGKLANIDLVKGRSNEYSSESSDSDDNEVDAEEDEDLHSIELHKEFKVDTDSYMEEVESPCVGKTLKQGARQGSEAININQVKAVENSEENRDRVKMWNFELDSPWRTEPKREKVDKRSPSSETDDARDIESNSKGEAAFLSNQSEPRCETLVQTSEIDRKFSALSEKAETFQSNGPPCEPSRSLSLEAVTNGVWSLQNLGSSRDMKGGSGLMSSSLQQCTSPTQKWCHSLSSPEAVRPQNASSAKPAKASVVGGVKAIKEKAVKGKISESKVDTKQPRFRICKAL